MSTNSATPVTAAARQAAPKIPDEPWVYADVCEALELKLNTAEAETNSLSHLIETKDAALVDAWDRLGIAERAIERLHMDNNVARDRADKAQSALDAAMKALRTIHDECCGERQCKTTAAIALCWPHPVNARPKVRGVSRVDDNPKALMLALDEVPSDDDIMAVQEALR